jgi:hypothetical protein
MPFEVKMLPPPLPTDVTVVFDKSVIIKIAAQDDPKGFLGLGFVKSENYENVYSFDSEEPKAVYAMLELLRDLDIPFSTHRHGGADYHLEWHRDHGHVSGKFKRLSRLGYDWEDEVPYQIEEF